MVEVMRGGEEMAKLMALIAYDDSQTLRFIRANLRASGYRVVAARTGKEVLVQFEKTKPDLVILDFKLPELDGLEICRQLREKSDIPIIITAERNLRHVVECFNAGADDYITKPFAVDELLVRVNALMRRVKNKFNYSLPEEVKLGDLIINFAQRRVIIGAETIHLTPTEFKLLTYLASHVNCVVPHDQILESIWGDDFRDCIHYLRVSIGRLRKKIERDPGNPEYIVTCSGVGYMLRNLCGG